MPFDDPDAVETVTTYSATSSTLDYQTTSAVTWKTWNLGVTYTMNQEDGLVVRTSNPLVWQTWSTGSASTTATGVYNFADTTASNLCSWTRWQSQPYSHIVGRIQEAGAYAPPLLTEEQRVERAAQDELRRQAAAVRTAQRAVAIEKADKLLDSVLNDAQREHLSRHDWFLLKGKNGTIYRIRRGRSANVDVLNKEGAVIARLCAHPAMAVPDGDTMVAQKLMLESEPEEFLRIANRHSVRDVPAVPREIMEWAT